MAAEIDAITKDIEDYLEHEHSKRQSNIQLVEVDCKKHIEALKVYYARVFKEVQHVFTEAVYNLITDVYDMSESEKRYKTLSNRI